MWDDVAVFGLMAATAFLAATMLPAQSELVFLGLLATSAVDPVALFVVASLANTAGSFTNWWLGRVLAGVSLAEQKGSGASLAEQKDAGASLAEQETTGASLAQPGGPATSSRLDRLPPWLQSIIRRVRPSPEAMAAGEARFRRWGWVALVFAWLPVVGDVATLAAGALNYPAGRFLALVGIGKAARYGLIWAGYGVAT